MENFDRKSQISDFTLATEKVIIFTNAADNGMTSFLLHVLKDDRYIFVRENGGGDIVMDSADSSSTKKQKDRTEMWDNIIELEEIAKYSTNLLYFVPTIGTYLRNKYRDAFEVLIKTSNDVKYSFENFLRDYFELEPSNTVYLIAEHIENCKFSFVQKLQNLSQTFSNVRIIITCDNAAPKAEIRTIFNDRFTSINFSKPHYNEAIEIFNGLHLNPEVYNPEMYNESKNILEFIEKYETKMQELNYTDPAKRVVMGMVAFIGCAFNEFVYDSLCTYLINCNRLDKKVDSKQLLSTLLANRILSFNGKYYTYNLKINSPKDNLSFHGFASYLLSEYKQVNFEVLYYLFTLYPGLLNLEMLLSIALSSKDEEVIAKVLEKAKDYVLVDYNQYCAIYKHLFNLKLFHLIPLYNGKVNSEVQHNITLLETIAREKSHESTSPKIYKQNIKQTTQTNIDFACLNEILLLDYSINHDRKLTKKIIKQKGTYNIQNFVKSHYFYILQSIAAFYLDDNELALTYYDEAIEAAPCEEKFLLINNKLAYLLSRFQMGLCTKKDLELTYNDLIHNFNGLHNSFIEHNVMLYKSLANSTNSFQLSVNSGVKRTWDLYKQLNYLICKYVFGKLDINEYLSIQNDVTTSNRLPSYGFYYYNLFLIAKEAGNKKYIGLAKRFLERNKKFQHSELAQRYKQVKNKSAEYIKNNKQSLVKYGLIFSRLFDLNYLLESMAEKTK